MHAIFTCTHLCKNSEGPRGLRQASAKGIRFGRIFRRAIFMENPHSGLLKSRDVVQGVPMRVLDYCQYANSDFPGRYRKRTSIWTNTNWYPLKPLCIPNVCHFCTDGKTHDHLAQQRPRNEQRAHCTKQLYRIPAALPQELVDYLHKMPEGQAGDKLAISW